MIGVAAQVSVYPLRQESLGPAIEQVLATFDEYDLQVEPGAMSSILAGDDAEVFAALRDAFCRVASQGHVVMVATLSNACPIRPREGG